MVNQDRFKFRAWDGFKMWKYAVPIFGKAYNGGTINVTDEESRAFNKFINGVLLQCTGMRDMEGNLVYEGMIVDKFYVVIFEAGKFQLEHLTTKDKIDIRDNQHKITGEYCKMEKD